MGELQYFLINVLTSKLDYITFSDHCLQCLLRKQIVLFSNEYQVFKIPLPPSHFTAM